MDCPLVRKILPYLGAANPLCLLTQTSPPQGGRGALRQKESAFLRLASDANTAPSGRQRTANVLPEAKCIIAGFCWQLMLEPSRRDVDGVMLDLAAVVLVGMADDGGGLMVAGGAQRQGAAGRKGAVRPGRLVQGPFGGGPVGRDAIQRMADFLICLDQNGRFLGLRSGTGSKRMAFACQSPFKALARLLLVVVLLVFPLAAALIAMLGGMNDPGWR